MIVVERLSVGDRNSTNSVRRISKNPTTPYVMLLFSIIYRCNFHSMGMFLHEAMQFSNMASMVTATHVGERMEM